MKDALAAKRYAIALFNLAQQNNELAKAEASLAEIRKLLEKHSEISHLVMNSTISREEKEDFLDKIFAPPISTLVVQFLKVLVRKKRFRDLDDVQKEFHKLYEEKIGVREVTVMTAVALSSTNLDKLTRILKQKLNADITLIAKVDPKLLGGMILRMGGQEINASYRNRLEELKQQLLA